MECETAVRVTCFEHCAPFSPCLVTWVRLDRPVEGGGSLAKSVGVIVFDGDLLAIRLVDIVGLR